MLRARRMGSGTLFIAIGAQRVEWGVSAAGQWAPDSLGETRINPVQGVSVPMEALSAALGQVERDMGRWRDTQSGDAHTAVRQVRVLVADSWLSVAGVPWSSSLQRAVTAGTFARGQLAAAGFEVVADDAVKLDDAPFGLPRVAVAYPASLLAALYALAGSLGADMTSVLPLSVAAWTGLPSRQRGKPDALAVLDEGMLLVAHGTACLTDVTVRSGCDSGVDDTSMAQLLSRLWQRMRLRDPQLMHVERLPVLSLLSPGALLSGAEKEMVGVELAPQPVGFAVSPRLHLAALIGSLLLPFDAVPPGSSMTPKRWGVASLAMLLTAVLMLEAWQTSGQAQALAGKLIATQNAHRIIPDSSSWSREETARIRAVNAAIRELNLPISALLRALLPPRDIRVAVLSVEVMGASSTSAGQTSGVKIVAEARTGAEMARYVGFVAERKPFAGAYLTHHEIDESMPERPYRFTVEAIWSD